MDSLEEVERQVRSCTDCPLAKNRNQAVPGEGSGRSRVIFIGEAPGFHEDQQGRPFVGASGHYLNQLLQSIKLERQDIYITNMVKCRPPNNRDPLPDEIRACKKYLDRQFHLLNPHVVVSLGRHSLTHFFPGETIGKAHGKAKKLAGVVYYPMYHPAAALHQNALRSVIEEDFQRLPEVLNTSSTTTPVEPTDRQLNMF